MMVKYLVDFYYLSPTLKRELKHFFPNLSEKVQRQYVAKKMKGIGESIKEKRKEIGIE